ncbi:MAG: hypothetical protein GY859_14285 [Desulfobacterales bacterium]|nr:hypothetical protein [Desulfobacterales bacterium]
MKLFLNLYKLQLNPANPNAMIGKFKRLPNNGRASEHAYELLVKHLGTWKSRRMSIDLIGEGAGSKSTIYKVVYDDVLVVKIPPDPVKDFDAYVEGLDRERMIFDLLSPEVHCITPSLADILGMLPRFSNKDDLPRVKYEIRCKRMLSVNPPVQEHLKIDGAFAFFMNLSKSSFLRQALDKMHRFDDRVEKEMNRYLDSPTELEVFERRHGKNNVDVFLDLNDVWSNYEMEMDQFLSKNGVLKRIPKYRLKKWFCLHLAEETVTESDTDLPANILDDLNAFIRKTVTDNRRTLEKTRAVISARFRHENFINNRSRFKGVITNILKLLSRLKDKGVAARDLKPDNIFLVTASPNVPLHPPSAETYSMGLIDLETAAHFQSINEVLIKQPMLAGTPSYATPAHLFENEILADALGDLPRTLYLQDWHAAAAMIYQTVIGEPLFEGARKFIPEIVKMRAEAMETDQPLVDVFKISTNMFWNYAREEFASTTGKNRDELEDVGVFLPNKIKKMLARELAAVKKILDAVIAGRILSQDMFKSDESRKRLTRSSHAAIAKAKRNWEKGVSVPLAPLPIRKRIVRFLGNLEKLKRESAFHVTGLKRLVRKQTEISVFDLLELMFVVVHRSMHPAEWEESPMEKTAPPTDKEIASYEETI